MDTIFAVSSGRPPAAIAVIRVSGPQALAAARTLAGSLPPERQAALRTLRTLRDGDELVLDRALVIVFPGPATATGEDLVELHCHGGRAVIAAVERTLGAIEGLRTALPGEFTRLALMNGRIDLLEAQGLADLLDAETEAQRVAALAAVEGRVSKAVRGWMEQVTALAARVEVLLDFSDEGDVDDDDAVLREIAVATRSLGNEIALVLQAPPVERLRDGIRVVIAGPPNSGKSTLLNLLADRDAAIVSPIAGTTRDRIEVPVARSGIAYLLVDTAGLVEVTDDPIEEIGVGRAREALATADIGVWIGDDAAPRDDAIWLHGRADLPGREGLPEGRILAVSCDDELTIECVWRLLEERARRLTSSAKDMPFRRSEHDVLEQVVEQLDAHAVDPLLLAERLRIAANLLGNVLGIDATNAMLDTLFSRFCIGK